MGPSAAERGGMVVVIVLPRLAADGPICMHISQPVPDAYPGLVNAIASLPDGIVNAGGLSQHGLVGGSVGTDDVEELFMEQRLDHFDRQESRTFPQRYYINRKYWAGASSGAPVFLCVGGEEGPFDATLLSESVACNDMIELAPHHEALLVSVEHRYYGESNPGDGWATESLRWLSSQQALADLSSFHGYLSDKKGLSGAEKWVTWGGSYPGMLAGWARLKFPHLFHAAVSSSSLLRAQVDFPEFTEVVRDSLASEAEGVGGSEECAVAVKTGHASIGELLQTREGRKFDLCNASCLEDESARIRFAGDGVVNLIIEDIDPASQDTVCSIRALCDIMTDVQRGSEMDRLADVRKLQRNPSGEARGMCEVFPPLRSPRDRAAGLGRDSPLAGALGAGGWVQDPAHPLRAWMYQACTEFGFYQTCEVGSRCPYTQGLHTLDVDLQVCHEAFGITPDQVREQVRLTNLYYGGDRPRGSRVIFPNGSIDPWHVLGVLETLTPDLPAIYVEGASHHFWTHPSKPTDMPNVVKAREIIWAQVTEWLAEED